MRAYNAVNDFGHTAARVLPKYIARSSVPRRRTTPQLRRLSYGRAGRSSKAPWLEILGSLRLHL